MRLSRTDLLPVLTIMAGGVIGASLSFSFLAQSVPALNRVVARSATADALSRARRNAEWSITVERASERAKERARVRLEVGQRRVPQDRPELRFANDVEEAQDRAEALLREQHVIEEGMKRLAEAGVVRTQRPDNSYSTSRKQWSKKSPAWSRRSYGCEPRRGPATGSHRTCWREPG